MKAKILTMYLDYVNNFLSETAYADYYGMTDKKATRLLAIGRKLAYK